ncbi:hypothetical protein ABT150_49210 [Streptomyces mirabilis]|uniref:hypothetical protein n=1 Tax=Streptomyces mirabilis TaxID=68239 RepID=UPI00332C53F9
MRRPPVLAARETPRSTIPLENLPAPSRRGATVLPLAPAFSDHPSRLDGIVEHIVTRTRTLDRFGHQRAFCPGDGVW